MHGFKNERFQEIPDDLEFFKLSECMKICRFTQPYVLRKAIKNGELPAIRLALHHTIVPKEAFIRWLLVHKMDTIAQFVATHSIEEMGLPLPDSRKGRRRKAA